MWSPTEMEVSRLQTTCDISSKDGSYLLRNKAKEKGLERESLE